MLLKDTNRTKNKGGKHGKELRIKIKEVAFEIGSESEYHFCRQR